MIMSEQAQYPNNAGPAQGAHYVNVDPSRQQQATVTIAGVGGPGRCSNCQVGLIQENFSICGILWAILCFPCGLICLLTMKEKKCGMCGAIY